MWIAPTAGLLCFTCSCSSLDTSACNCTTQITVPIGAHCTIIEDFNPVNSSIALSYAFANSSLVQIRDLYYLMVDESMFFNETTVPWQNKVNRITFGCDWDSCNQFDLVDSLPNSFNLTIDSAWLDENIYSNVSVSNCYSCSNAICANLTTPVNFELCPNNPCADPSTVSQLKRMMI